MNADQTFASFEVCCRCYELRGPFDYTWKGTHYSFVQECRCERDARPHEAQPATWMSFDFNSGAELCNLCGAAILRSGSRWSLLFCGDCLPRVVALNEDAGVVLVPIGRHSMMHGVGLRAGPAPSGDFVARFGALVDRMRRVSAWSHEVVRRNLADVGLDQQPSVALPTYMQAVADVDRQQRFDDMMEWLTTHAVEADFDLGR